MDAEDCILSMERRFFEKLSPYFEIKTAYSSSEAVDLLKVHNFNLIFTEYFLTHGHVEEILPHVPAEAIKIAVSSTSLSPYSELIFDAVLYKPFSLAEFEAIFDRSTVCEKIAKIKD